MDNVGVDVINIAETVIDVWLCMSTRICSSLRIAIERTNYEGVRPQSFRLQMELLVPTRAQCMRLHRSGSYKLGG